MHDTQLEFTELNNQIVNCRKCPRLVNWREKVAREKKRAYQEWDYWGKPVPAFGDPQARVLVVGLAPGAHGSNRTGRMFTGDASGVFLFAALHRSGFANQPTSVSREDGLSLQDMLISAVCRCVPPDNKPTPYEIHSCQVYLEREISLLENLQGIIALGRIAFDTLLTIYSPKIGNIQSFHFAHGAFYQLGEGLPWLLASYHPSRQNTQTGRLTEAMFDEIWTKARNVCVPLRK